MPKRKNISGDDSDRDSTIPLPIQTFFWRQTSPFIRPKLGKLSEASCVSFERVVVQNILHGLSPSLCEAIQSISRWRVIQAAFPHLMHACASLLNVSFTSSETKLLYILHWIILDAASECEDLETDPQRNGTSVQLHSLSTVQLFIYLFAPLIHCMNDSDFQTLKLENGLRLWQPLWDYRQPDLPCFSTPVKPQRNVLKAQRNLLKVNTNAANIYIGKGTSREDLIFDFGSRRTSYSEPQSPLAPLARMSDICALSTTDSHSVNCDAMCEHCNTPMVVQETGDSTRRCSCGRKESLVSHPFDAPKISVFHRLPSSVDKDFAKQRLVSAVTSGVRGPTTPDILSASYFDIAVIRCLFCLHWSDEGIYWALRYMHQRLLEVCDEFVRLDFMERERSRSLPFPDIQLLQSMSLPRSSFERYLELQRKNNANGSQNKKPTVHVPTLATIPSSKEISETAVLAKTENETDSRREPAFKRNRVSELKSIYDVKVGVQLKSGADISNFNKAQKSEGNTASGYNPLTKNPVKCTYGKLSKDELSSSVSTVDTDPDVGSSNPVGNNGNSKSVTFPSAMKYPVDTDKKLAYQNPWMAKTSKQTSSNFDKYQSHHIHSDRESFDSSSRESSASSQLGEVAPSGGGKQIIDLQHNKPVIRITEHSNQNRLRNLHLKSSSGILPTQNPSLEQGISRSLTDSHINYHHEEDVHEVPGSVHYIQDNGHLNYKVILRAVHFIAMNQRNQKICEVLLNIITCLLDLDIIERKTPAQPESAKKPSSPDTAEPSPSEPVNKPSTPENTPASSSPGDSIGKNKGEVTAHGLAMESLLSIIKALGCSHGCSDGVRGPHGDHLRSKGHNCLQRLQRINSSLFRTYLRDYVKKSPIQETVDFLHAFLGFCIDPTLILQLSNSQQEKKKGNSQEKVTPTQNGFSNNFGHSIGGVGYRGVEGVLIANILKPFVTRCVESTKELYSSDNISLFCDVRQLIAYVKEIHGGTFRRVELSALLDSYHKLQQKEKEKEEKVKAAMPIRRTTSQTSDSGDEAKIVNLSSTEESGGGKPRRNLLKKKLKKRTAKSDHEDDNMSDPPPLDRRESKSEIQFPRPAGLKGKMSFKTASHATITFLNWKQQQTTQTEDTESETLIVREKKLVDKYIIKSGMLRFAFLLECCPPGSIPDPQLVAAMLELEAPVTARASMLLECAHFIHRCNHGDWPNWMRLNIPSFRQSSSALQSRGQPSGFRRTLTLQKAAGRMFYSWAENLGCMLEYILSKEYTNRLDVISDIYSDAKKKELRSSDEEEDFLDEATVNENGSECPYALKMIACLVLQEITTFLRETFRDLPKSRSPRRETVWERNMTSRRWSSIVSSPGHSQSSESNVADLPHSASGVAVGSPSGAERKISFAVLGDRSDSIHSSTTSISMLDPNMPPHTPVEERKGRRLAHGRQKLLKQLRRGSGHNTSFRHNRSFRLKRQEGGSDKVIEEDDDGESVLSEDIYDTGENHPDTDDTSMCQNMPWIKNFCHPNCYERQRRSCSRLVTALRKIYQSSETDDEDDEKARLDAKRDLLKERLRNRGESVFHQTSPTKRRESTPLLEKIKSDVSISKIKLSSTTSSSLKKEEKIKEVKEDSAQKLTQCPMGIIAKAAPILSEENLTDILPVAWELILESDQELAAAAVWPRMEDGANLFFKIPPPNIDFTLPSPTIGLPSQTVVDPPWTPHFKAKIEEVTVNQEETKSVVTATTTRRKEQQEMIRKALQAEEERKRVGRETFPMTTVGVCQLAAHEPALHHVSEEHEEGSTFEE
ncbi:hypothetical protein KUTeg_021400 [Tegillarca granosa]|uniref:Protein unc-80 homolog n=1 Tax=Tegillarca granosa TaxID=220873 RepID=A0ABQ9E615_TEGGR|nr:hypothetical protein KUTeg_021400 [Tegillarca granosa]